MNEISSYDPELYHATLTHSVFVRLQGSVIRLSKPNHNIARRAAHNEPKPDVSYVSQKIYDLSNSKVSGWSRAEAPPGRSSDVGRNLLQVYLMPPNLARKRIWNKKYPICIHLGKQDDFMSKAEGDRLEGGGEERSSCSSGRELTLYLFGRTGREKEEWFQHFLAASRLKAELKRASAVTGTRAGESRVPSRWWSRRTTR